MSTFKNYTIIKSLGKGGMAEVFLAEDIRFKTKVAIKVLNSDFSSNSNISQRFIAEARNLFRMSHPNVVRVIDLIEEEGKKAFVMEYIDGNNLRDEIERSKNVSQVDIRSWMPQMLSALGYCHSEGIVHRDIKPSNFMLNSRGQIKLLDFGIAKNVEKNVGYTPTTTTHMMGTPIYMSPEQINESKSVDYRSDIYSLGVVLWQLVTGKPPYDSHILSTFQIQLKIVKDPLSSTGSKFDEIIQRCTAKDPKDRFQKCEDVTKELLKIFNSDEAVVTIPGIDVINQKKLVLGNNLKKLFFFSMLTILIVLQMFSFFDRAPKTIEGKPEQKGQNRSLQQAPVQTNNTINVETKKVSVELDVVNQDIDKDGFTDDLDKCKYIYGKDRNGCPTLWQEKSKSGNSRYIEKCKDGIWREGPGPEPRFQWKEVRCSYDSIFFSSVDRVGNLMVLTNKNWLFKYSKRDVNYLTLAAGSWK